MTKFQVAYVPVGVPTFHLESAQKEFEKSRVKRNNKVLKKGLRITKIEVIKIIKEIMYSLPAEMPGGGYFAFYEIMRKFVFGFRESVW